MNVFKAKYYGICADQNCEEKIKPNDECVYVDGQVIHASCATGLAPERNWPERSEPDPEPYRIAGKRKPKLCTSCFTEHTGECL